MSYMAFWKPGGLEISLKGVVTFSNLLKLNQEIYDNALFNSIKYRIIDLSEIKYLKLSEAEMSALGTMDRVASMWTPRIKNAVIGCKKNLLPLFLVYQEQLKRANWDTKFFSELSEAEQWIEPVEKIELS